MARVGRSDDAESFFVPIAIHREFRCKTIYAGWLICDSQCVSPVRSMPFLPTFQAIPGIPAKSIPPWSGRGEVGSRFRIHIPAERWERVEPGFVERRRSHDTIDRQRSGGQPCVQNASSPVRLIRTTTSPLTRFRPIGCESDRSRLRFGARRCPIRRRTVANQRTECPLLLCPLCFVSIVFWLSSDLCHPLFFVSLFFLTFSLRLSCYHSLFIYIFGRLLCGDGSVVRGGDNVPR